VSLAAFNHVLAGRVAHLDDDPAAARRHFQAAAQALTAIGSDRSVARTWFELAGLLAEVGDTEAAAAAYRSAGAANGLRVT
jgi:Tfp pilus assembly protein PilF